MRIPGFGELGSTTDPVALVAGSVENVLADACDLRVRADELSDQADGPVSATVPSWTGPSATASNANRANLAQGLTAVADVYRTVATVLEAHAEVLRWAQTRAQIAIELWARGVELAAASGESTLLLRPQPTGPFARGPVFPETDPGAPWRRQAEAVLAAARAEVNASGQAAARILDEFSAGMPDGQFHMDQFLGGIGDWITGIATLVWKFNAIRALIDRDAMLDDADQIRQGLWDTGAAITADPTQAVPLLFNTRLMHDNPGRWWGQLFPDIALTAAGGTGLITKSGWFARSADTLDDLADVGRAENLLDELPPAVPEHSASFGWTESFNYRDTFFDVHPELRHEVWVHHAVEQQVLRRYPGEVAAQQMHSLENLSNDRNLWMGLGGVSVKGRTFPG